MWLSRENGCPAARKEPRALCAEGAVTWGHVDLCWASRGVPAVCVILQRASWDWKSKLLHLCAFWSPFLAPGRKGAKPKGFFLFVAIQSQRC